MRTNLGARELEYIVEDHDEQVEEIRLSLRDLRLTFYFDLSGVLCQVSWGVLFDDDDKIIWPDPMTQSASSEESHGSS